VVAGLTVWAVLVPEALAYASIAGVSLVVGLYAARRRCCCTPPSAAPGAW
jgi:MFS superfamily sulfate permease-like transporter